MFSGDTLRRQHLRSSLSVRLAQGCLQRRLCAGCSMIGMVDTCLEQDLGTFRASCQDMVDELEELRRRCGAPAHRARITRLLFIITRCSRLVFTGAQSALPCPQQHLCSRLVLIDNIWPLPCHSCAASQEARCWGQHDTAATRISSYCLAFTVRVNAACSYSLSMQEPLEGPRSASLTWLHVSAEEADSGGRHQHYMTQPKGRLQKGMRHRTDIPTGGPPSSGLEAGTTPAASIRRSTTMPQRWCVRHGSAGHGCAHHLSKKALRKLEQISYAGSLTMCTGGPAHAGCNIQSIEHWPTWLRHMVPAHPGHCSKEL